MPGVAVCREFWTSAAGGVRLALPPRADPTAELIDEDGEGSDMRDEGP